MFPRTNRCCFNASSHLKQHEVATIFLDRNLCIRKFTPEMARIFRLMPQDVGRSIEGFVHHIREPRIVEGLHHVRDSGETIESEIQIAGDRSMDAHATSALPIPRRK